MKFDNNSPVTWSFSVGDEVESNDETDLREHAGEIFTKLGYLTNIDFEFLETGENGDIDVFIGTRDQFKDRHDVHDDVGSGDYGYARLVTGREITNSHVWVSSLTEVDFPGRNPDWLNERADGTRVDTNKLEVMKSILREELTQSIGYAKDTTECEPDTIFCQYKMPVLNNVLVDLLHGENNTWSDLDKDTIRIGYFMNDTNLPTTLDCEKLFEEPDLSGDPIYAMFNSMKNDPNFDFDKHLDHEIYSSEMQNFNVVFSDSYYDYFFAKTGIESGEEKIYHFWYLFVFWLNTTDTITNTAVIYDLDSLKDSFTHAVLSWSIAGVNIVDWDYINEMKTNDNVKAYILYLCDQHLTTDQMYNYDALCDLFNTGVCNSIT